MREGDQIGHLGEVSHVPLEVGLLVAEEPELAARRVPQRHRRQAPVEDLLLAEDLRPTVPRQAGLLQETQQERWLAQPSFPLAASEGVKRQVERPAGERLADPTEKRQVGRTAQQKAARGSALVHRAFDGQQEVRAALDLIDGQRLLTGDQRVGVPLCRLEGCEIVERQVPPLAQGLVTA